jgi:NAD(P)-dependent dehydrogenase (short-subunit alcohol dehydrogenase family)
MAGPRIVFIGRFLGAFVLWRHSSAQKGGPEGGGGEAAIGEQEAECRSLVRRAEGARSTRNPALRTELDVTALADKTAIITGASSGIGRATAILFAREGANLVLAARRKPELDALVAEIEALGRKAVAVAGDVKDEALAETLVATARDRFGGLDIAFNNAGTLGEMGPAPGVSTQGWRDTLETNLTSAFLGAKYQIPAMLERGGGSLIFTSTFVGHTVGFPGMAAYAASKAGLIGLMQVIATEFGAKGIRANAILPGGTDTPMGRTITDTPDAKAFVESLHALKRIASPDEIARSVFYLASGASSFVTGAALLVDGGASITRT